MYIKLCRHICRHTWVGGWVVRITCPHRAQRVTKTEIYDIYSESTMLGLCFVLIIYQEIDQI